jgi:hypothetical protein
MMATFTSICDKRSICRLVSISPSQTTLVKLLTKIESYDMSLVTLYNHNAYTLTMEATTAIPPTPKTPSSANRRFESNCSFQKGLNGRRKIAMSVRILMAPSAK